MKNKYKKTYFTLTEIMIVMAIIGLLAAIVGSRLVGKLDDAKVSSTKVQMNILKQSILDYYIATGEYPSRLQDLVTDPGNVIGWKLFLEKKSVPKDAWGNAFYYGLTESSDQAYELKTLGADKTPGGDKLNKDISVWDE